MAKTDEKGSLHNPYTMEEFEELADAGSWTGGYVTDDAGNVVYMMKELIVSGSGSGSGSGKGSGSNFEFASGSYTYHHEDEDEDDEDDENGNHNGNGDWGGNKINDGSNGTGGSNTGVGGQNSNTEKVTLKSETTTLIIERGANMLSESTIQSLLNIEGYSGKIIITNTARSPEDQARIMYENILKTSVEYQKSIYRNPGKQVIDVYNPALSRYENIQLMKDKILEVGPQKVSKHCSDYNVLNVFDISIARSTNTTLLESILRSRETYKVLNENNCIHVEIPQ